MEGDGEGLVAIVQGLDTSGVTLTVCNRARHNSVRRRSSRSRIHINAGIVRPADMPVADHRSNTFPANYGAHSHLRSSAETSTGTDFTQQHASSQICDGRYASSYKMAHCMVTPTSPPEAVSEFPPQRKEPCRNQGNFEIGGHGSAHSSGKVRVCSSRVRYCGGSQTLGDKGSSHRYCKSHRDTEAFAHSLRNYPSIAPFRTASNDLIEKLIRYTQAKNFQEMSRSSKSMRSLRQQKSSDAHELGRASKHQQTYTRRQDSSVINNSNVQVRYKGTARNFKLYSPMSDSRNLKQNRHKETSFSSSYDYLKAGLSPYGRPDRSDETPSPVESSSPERTRSPEVSRSPERIKSPEVSRSPVRFKSIDGFKTADALRSPDRLNRLDRPIRYQRSVRDVSLNDMSKYIRSTIRQICNERPVVFQVCPKLKNRYKQHKTVCPNKSDRAIDVLEDDLDEDEDKASGSVISRFIQSFSGCGITMTEQVECQCTRIDCSCSKATQCVNNPEASTNTHSACSCKIPMKIGCCRGMPCVCASKSQDQAYYNQRIDEEIAEWLKEVPVHSVEGSVSKMKRDTIIKELRKTLKQLPDDENYEDNAQNEIKIFTDEFPMWNPGKDRKEQELFKNQLADKLTERILSVPKQPDRLRDIVKKWIANLDFEDDGEYVDKEAIIDTFVNKLKSMAVDRPACDVKYTHILRKEIIELLVELALKFNGDMVMLKKMANKLATDIVHIPRNVNLSGDTTDLTDDFEENVSDWICEHGLCRELKKDPKLIESLAKKLNKLKSQGIDNECVVGEMKKEIHKFVDDVGIAIESVDELVDELMSELSDTVQTNEMERLDQDELTEEFTNWLNKLPGASDLHPRKFEKIVKELVKMIIEGREQGNENLANDILNYLVNADLGIYPADWGIQVEELMEKLNLLPSKKYHKEQIKKAMIKDIFDIIENLSISENKKKELRERAHQIVENHLLRSSLDSKEEQDGMRDAIMDDMDDVISNIDIPKESQLLLKTSLGNLLNSNYEKSFMRLRRLSREGSDLKQTIAKGVRNAVKELSIDKDKKKDLIQQIKGTLSKNMHKPLPNNLKNTINGEISNIIERCPTCKDNSILDFLKKVLLAVASKHLNICLPKSMCNIQYQVEKDVGIIIDNSSLDIDTKKDLKNRIQNILKENEDRQLTDEVLSTIKEDIRGVVSALSIPQDKKNVLKKTVGETISKHLNEALSNLRHDLDKIRNELFDDICKIVDNSRIPRDIKTHLKNKLKPVLARNLDSSLSDEEKHTILEDVSNIIKDDMPVDKRKSLTKNLAKTLDTKERKEDTNDIDALTESLKEMENKILEYILREMEQAVEEAIIPKEGKLELKEKLKIMGTIDYSTPAEDIEQSLITGINEILEELNLPRHKKNELKSELAAAIDEHGKLLTELKNVAPEYIQLKRRSSTDAKSKHKKIGKGLIPIEEIDETTAKDNILQGIEDIVDESTVPKEGNMELIRKLKKMATDNLRKPFSDDVEDAIKIGIADILDEVKIPQHEKDELKRALGNMTDENLANLRDVDIANAKESMIQGIDRIIKGSAIPEDKQIWLQRKLKEMTANNLRKPFSDDLEDAIKISIADILDELQAPILEKNKLKHALIGITKDYLQNLREAKRPEKDNNRNAKESILKDIDDIIEESAVPGDKKMELKRKLKKMATNNLRKPFSDNMEGAIKIGIAGILDEVIIPKSEKDKLKRALLNMTDVHMGNLRDVDKAKAKESVMQGMEGVITESAIPEKKKTDLKKKLTKLIADQLKQPMSDDVEDNIKIGIADVLDELEIPKPEKDKLKRALVNMTHAHMANLRDVDKANAKESIMHGIDKIVKGSAIPEEQQIGLQQKLKEMTADNLKKTFSDDVEDAIKIGITDIIDELPAPTSEKNKLKRALVDMTKDYLNSLRETKRPLGSVDEIKAKENILKGIERIIAESDIPEEKKIDLKKKLKKITADRLNKPLSDDVEDDIKIGIDDIIEELKIPKPQKDKLKRALVNMTDENVAKLRDIYKAKAKESIMQGIDQTIKSSDIPEKTKMGLKRKLKEMAADNLKTPLSDNAEDAIKIGIADLLDELQAPTSEKNKLKHALIDMTKNCLGNVRKAEQPLEKIDDRNGKESILEDIEDIVEESAVPVEKKMELKRKLKKITTDNLRKPLRDDVEDAIRIGIADLLDELKIPKSVKDKLKRALVNMTDAYMTNSRDVDKANAKESMMQGIDRIIKGSVIPEDKKIGLKRKLKEMAADNLRKPFSDDVEDAIKIGITDILNELQAPSLEKNKLKRALIDMTKDYSDNVREAKRPFEKVEKKANESILNDIEDIIEESAVPEEKKMKLKRKLKKITADQLKTPLSDDVENDIKIGIADILDEVKIPEPEKDKLKRALVNMTDENVANLRNVVKSKAKDSIMQGIDRITKDSDIPEKTKIELKRELKQMTTENLKKPFSDDVEDAIKMGISDVLHDLQIAKPEKNKLKHALVNMIDENVANLRNVDKAKGKENIMQGIDRIIKGSDIPEERKIGLQRKLKEMAADNLRKPFSDDIEGAIKIGIADILDELQAPIPEKNKLKRALIDMTQDYMENFREAKQPLEFFYEKKAKESILKGIEDIIEVSPIPGEKKMDLKKKLKKIAADNFKKLLSDGTQDNIKIGIDNILDELQIPISEKNKLKHAVLNTVDDHIDNLRDTKPVRAIKGTKPEVKNEDRSPRERILQGIKKIIEDSAIPEEKQTELERKLKEMTNNNLKKPFSDDVEDSIKIGIDNILDELQIPISKKNKLKRALLNLVDDNIDNFRDIKPVRTLKGTKAEGKIDDVSPRERILQGIENIIEDSAIPEEKQTKLEKKLKKMTIDNLKKHFSDDVEDSIKIGIADILDQIQIPKSEKNKLKRALINMADENMADLRSVAPKLPKGKNLTKTQKDMLLGLEKAISEAPIHIENKKELKAKLRGMAAVNLESSPDDFEESLKNGIHEIIRQLNSSKHTKYPYKTKTDGTDSKIKGPRSPVSEMPLKGLMPIEEVDETTPKENFLTGINKIIEESAIPENKKVLLKRKLKKMATDNFKKPISDDVQDNMKFGIADILDELQVPSSEKNKLKRALLNIVDENVDTIQGVHSKSSSQTFKELESDTQNNILVAFENVVDEAPIPIDKKKELKKKLKGVATKIFQKSLRDDTVEALKDGVDEILDELNVSKDKKNKLKRELTVAVDEYLSNLKNEICLAKSMQEGKGNKLNVIIRRVLPQFDEAVDPSYQKQLAEEFDELLEIALTDGDFNDTRKKLVNKLMREQNLSEKEASAPVDELIGRAREMALKEEKHELDPSYVKTLEPDINDLVGIALKDGDFEEARKKLSKKLMREQNLPEEEANACTDDLIAKAQNLAIAAQAKDKSLLHKKTLANAVSDAVDQSTISIPEKSNIKNKLLGKLKQQMDKKTYINRDDLEPLISEVLKDLKKIIEDSLIPTASKNELTSLLNENLANTIDTIMDQYDVEEGYTKDYTKALSKVVNKTPMRNLEKSYLKKDLAKTFEGIVDDSDDDEIIKHKDKFTKAINNAVNQSALSKPEKKGLKNKLLNKMDEILDDSFNTNDIGALKAEVLKECKNLVDDSLIPMNQKNVLKILLEEEIMDDNDDDKIVEEGDDNILGYKETFAKTINDAVRKSPDMDDYDETEMEEKLKKYNDAFAETIKQAVDQSSLHKSDNNNIKNKLLCKLNETIDNSLNLYDMGALTAEVLKDSKNVVDVSSLPPDKKKELKLLLQQSLENDSKELMDDDEILREAIAVFTDNIAEIVKTWMQKLPIDLDPEHAIALAIDIASDIVDRQKYLQLHPEAYSSDKDEIENLKYQIFRRMKDMVDPKYVPVIMNGTEELYRMLMNLEPPPGFPKFDLREQSTSESCRRDPVAQPEENNTCAALSAGNINYSLKELIATSKSIRKHWSRNLDKAATKLPLPRNEKSFLKEEFTIYDETDQINVLSTKSRAKEKTSTAQSPKSKKHVTPKSDGHVVLKPQKNNKERSSRLSKIEKALTFNNSTRQKSPFAPKSNQAVDEKDFRNFTADTIKAWLEKLRYTIKTDAKNKVIEDLTNDVVDRKKYIQIFGSEDPTRSDDLEYLKLQVHRRLNALVPAEALKAVIVDTKVLLNKIDTIKMKVPPAFTPSLKSQKRGEKQGIADILHTNAKATNTLVNVNEEEREEELLNMEFSPGETSTPEKHNDEPTSEQNKAKVEELVETWLETMPIDLDPKFKTEFIDELANDIVYRKKYLQVQPDKPISKKEEIENLKFQVFKRLYKANPDACVNPDDEKVEELYKMIGIDVLLNFTKLSA